MGIASSLIKLKKAKQIKIKNAALSQAKIIARLLGKKFGATKVMLYGSLTRKNEQFDNASDIDLAVRGLGRSYLKAYAYCLKLSKFPIDIKPYEDMPDDFRREAEKGRVLYEKK